MAKVSLIYAKSEGDSAGVGDPDCWAPAAPISANAFMNSVVYNIHCADAAVCACIAMVLNRCVQKMQQTEDG